MSAGGNYTVTPFSPVQLFSAKDKDCFIYNTSNVTVYLDSYPGMTSNVGMPLPAQSSKLWLQGDPCYAITGVGDTGTLNITENAGEVVNPAAIANSLISSGLATAI